MQTQMIANSRNANNDFDDFMNYSLFVKRNFCVRKINKNTTGSIVANKGFESA